MWPGVWTAIHGPSLPLLIAQPLSLRIHRKRSYAAIYLWRTAMRKTLIALIAIVATGTVLPTVALARGGFHGGGYRAVSWGGGWRAGYRWHGPDWWGVTGVGGYGYGYGYPYGYAPYYGNDGCYLVRQRFWDGYGWRPRAVQVCG
jgi:hypothetical protein